MRAEHNNISPDAVEDIAVREDPHIEVWLNYIVELPVLLVPEKRIRHPDLQTTQSESGEEEQNCILSSLSLTLSFSVIVR